MKGQPPPSSYPPRGSKLNLFFSFCSIVLCLSVYQHIPRFIPLLQQNQSQAHFNLEQLLLSVPDPAKARQWSSSYSSEPHFAGQCLSNGLWTQAKWEEFGVETTSLHSYPLPYPMPMPVSSRLALLNQANGQVLYEAELTENVTDVNPLTGEIVGFPPFFSFSPSYNTTASVIYANYGTVEDFEDLARANVSVAGKLAIVKFKILAEKFYDISQQTGVAGWVVYMDPQYDGEITEQNGYLPYPQGPARAPTSVSLRSRVQSSKDSPPVPVMLISFADAVPILKALNGIGPRGDDLGVRWQGGQLGHRGVEYNVGPSSADVVLNMQNEVKDTQATLYTVVGEIQGVIRDEVVIIGNHRDAWVSGAGDPGSGSACLNEVIRSFGQAVQQGWQPLRTLIFISWDGNEPGLLGSTNWVKENLPWLFNRTVAYIDTVTAVAGHDLDVRFSPLLAPLVRDVTGRIHSPNQTIPGQTVLDVWGGVLQREGGGDANPFVQKTITSGQFGFKRGPQDAVWHKHSGFDTVQWMDRFGDPTWQYHVKAAQIWALLAARLVDSPVYPFSVTEYAVSLNRYLANIQKLADEKSFHFDFHPLHEALARLHTIALQFDAEADILRKDHASCKSRTNDLATKTQAINTKYRLFEREFYFEDDVGDPDHNHVVFNVISRGKDFQAELPDLWNAVEERNVAETEKWHNIVRSKVEDATAYLQS
ncbi:hypothetical protein BDV41DRAFT_133458 [Aspergillus transmontanensis]|uniref:Peptidase M28 n=1 Tax=Aspergillus transmontanensis TaxID=1034304 RepID=A0A5N6W5E8_9EURO|nr:hypothetical protein BDV41DRAFT_133458 [Aspergillus transmontanensis]